MPRDRKAWNKAIGKTIGFLQRRNSPANSLDAPTAYINSLDASATGLGVSDIGNSMRSTSNSQAASRAIVRARKVVLQALDELAQSGDDGSFPDPQLIDYIRTIESYRNHVVSGHLKDCHLTRSKWEMVCHAAHAAKAVHKMDNGCHGVQLVPGSLCGPHKSFSITEQDNALIVAVRATRGTLDWTMNLNAEPLAFPEVGDEYFAHRGFLLEARKLRPQVKEALAQSKYQHTKVIFTGHSSGAAVAQLLFMLNFLQKDDSQDMTFGETHCITFGGPPVTSPSLQLPPDSGSCAFINIMNEGDPVVLLEPTYAESLLRAYNSQAQGGETDWELPNSRVYQPGGTLILMRDISVDERGRERPAAYWVDELHIECLIFGNPLRHSMTLYLNRLIELRDESTIDMYPT